MVRLWLPAQVGRSVVQQVVVELQSRNRGVDQLLFEQLVRRTLRRGVDGIDQSVFGRVGLRVVEFHIGRGIGDVSCAHICRRSRSKAYSPLRIGVARG
jgi:hypothetical protein